MNFEMNSAEGKAILAKVRRGDFAHPGEEEAIQLIVSGLDRVGISRILDVGCGRGGTAQWFHKNGWGKVFGIDIDHRSIDYAQTMSPVIEYLVKDVNELDQWNIDPFDFVYLLNSFYSFSDQKLALKKIRHICRHGASLRIFDYTRRRDAIVPGVLGTDIGNPIVIEVMPTWLSEAGWKMEGYQDFTTKYIEWYNNLLAAFQRDQQWIDNNFGEDWRRYVNNWYGSLRDSLEAQVIRGVLFSAKAS